MSKALGEGEIERIKISTSESDNGNSTSTTTERRQGERVVMTADIQNLPKLSGFLNIAGDIPVCPITVKIVEYASKIEPFEAKKRARNALAMPGEAPPGFKLDFDETANTGRREGGSI
jgi:type IV secretory pathway TraG/TraD family ATPase VirD4